MQDSNPKFIKITGKRKRNLAFQQVPLELMTRFELVTSSLPRMRSTD